MGFAVNRPYGLPNPRDSDSIRGRPVKRRTFLLAPATTGQLYPTDQPFYFPAVDYFDPLAVPKLEALYDSWIFLSSARRAKITGFLKFPAPIFWNVAQA